MDDQEQPTDEQVQRRIATSSKRCSTCYFVSSGGRCQNLFARYASYVLDEPACSYYPLKGDVIKNPLLNDYKWGKPVRLR